jgi:hypothetical protein
VESNIVPIVITLVLIGIILLILAYRTKWFARFRSANGEDFDEVGPAYREHPDPAEIMHELDTLPPAQRASVLHHYAGLPVKWHVILHSARPSPGGNVALYLTYQHRRHLVGIVCSADLKQYPALKMLKQGHKLWLAGKIESVSDYQSILLAPGTRLKIDK